MEPRGIDYRKTWRILLNSPKKNEWKDFLTLVPILFIMPVSNAVTEGVFTGFRHIFTDYRGSLDAQRLSNLMKISSDGARSKFWGLSGSEDRGGGDNSIQFTNFGRVGDKSFKEWRQKLGEWMGG